MEAAMQAQVKDLLGKTLTSVQVNSDNDEIDFIASDGSTYKLFHDQD
jgi:hypothetical protein